MNIILKTISTMAFTFIILVVSGCDSVVVDNTDDNGSNANPRNNPKNNPRIDPNSNGNGNNNGNSDSNKKATDEEIINAKKSIP